MLGCAKEEDLRGRYFIVRVFYTDYKLPESRCQPVIRGSPLLYDAESKMGSAGRGLYHLHSFQLNLFSGDIFK